MEYIRRLPPRGAGPMLSRGRYTSIIETSDNTRFEGCGRCTFFSSFESLFQAVVHFVRVGFPPVFGEQASKEDCYPVSDGRVNKI